MINKSKLLEDFKLTKTDVDKEDLTKLLDKLDMKKNKYNNIDKETQLTKLSLLNSMFTNKPPKISPKILNEIYRRYPVLKETKYIYVENIQEVRTQYNIICVDNEMEKIIGPLYVSKLIYLNKLENTIKKIMTYDKDHKKRIIIDIKKYYIFREKTFIEQLRDEKKKQEEK